jgi:SAM-dependent methyltransferase
MADRDPAPKNGDANYATGFGAQWRHFQRTQLDSYTGTSYSRDRLVRCLGVPLDRLAAHRVLEVGCGAGRFTEWLLKAGAQVVAIDLSDAVIANRANCAPLGRYSLVQADINLSPLCLGTFDLVLCLGVIQHTPSPEETIANLARHCRPGGRLVIDHYTWSWWNRIGMKLTLKVPLRAILRRVARRRPDLSLRLVRAMVAVCDPIRRYTCRWRLLDRIAGRIFPSNCYYRTYPGLAPHIVYEWNVLDTHDTLTDWYKHRRTLSQIRTALEASGMREIECWLGGNGVEARAVAPLRNGAYRISGPGPRSRCQRRRT